MNYFAAICFLLLSLSVALDLIICRGKATLWFHANFFLWMFLTFLWVALSALNIYVTVRG